MPYLSNYPAGYNPIYYDPVGFDSDKEDEGSDRYDLECDAADDTAWCVDDDPGCLGVISVVNRCYDCDGTICRECAVEITDSVGSCSALVLCSECAYRRLLAKGGEEILRDANGHFADTTGRCVDELRENDLAVSMICSMALTVVRGRAPEMVQPGWVPRERALLLSMAAWLSGGR